ncbi:MAG: hypothetical protein Kow00127_22580 [Bacteroidales bacterium]
MIMFTSCQKNELEEIDQPDNIMPERFRVEIPSSISSGVTYKQSQVDTLQGDDIYNHLRTFIWVGDHAAEVVSDIIQVIALHHLSQPMEFSFTSDDDGRLKHVVIVANATFEGVTWEYKLTMTDAEPAISSGDNIAMQIFWNKSPIKGVSLINPWNLDRTTDPEYVDVMYRIDYSEAGELGYEQHMIVTIDGLPLANPLDDPYSMSTLKMFVGRNGDAISVFGNSEHPNALFFNGDTGFDWAFTAAGLNSTDIGVAEVGLPDNELNSFDRYTLLVENSIKNVFTQQIYETWPGIDSTTVQAYLYNTDAPGFFDHNGFVQGGTAPGPEYNPLINIIAGLTPYNPAEIHNLTISFDN